MVLMVVGQVWFVRLMSVWMNCTCCQGLEILLSLFNRCGMCNCCYSRCWRSLVLFQDPIDSSMTWYWPGRETRLQCIAWNFYHLSIWFLTVIRASKWIGTSISNCLLPQKYIEWACNCVCSQFWRKYLNHWGSGGALIVNLGIRVLRYSCKPILC